MHYYTHNIGDFSLQTRFLNPEEIGVYVLLRDQYIATEAPLQSSWIALAMHPQCKSSVERVLALFFTETESGWTCSAFENLIKEYKEESDKKRVNALKRWEKAKSDPETDARTKQNDAGAMQIDAGAMQLHSFAMLTNNQEPITNNHKPITKNQEEEDGSALVLEPEQAPAARKPTSSSSRGTQFGLDSIPDDWRDYAETTYPDLDSSKLFAEFSDYWKGIPGEKGRKKDWAATWRNHLRNLPTWKHELFAKQGAKTADKGLAFGSVSERYAHVLSSKLAATHDPALSSISYGCQSWDDAAKVYARMLLSSEESFETIKAYLIKHGIIRM